MPLPQLTNSNLEVKKFVAFQEGFERLFDIMSSEGMLEGGSVIVKDCLLVCTNLLTGSSLTKVGCLISGEYVDTWDRSWCIVDILVPYLPLWEAVQSR